MLRRKSMSNQCNHKSQVVSTVSNGCVLLRTYTHTQTIQIIPLCFTNETVSQLSHKIKWTIVLFFVVENAAIVYCCHKNTSDSCINPFWNCMRPTINSSASIKLCPSPCLILVVKQFIFTEFRCFFF